jgi:hypothetical protein
MKTLWCKNQENPSDRISHTWAPLTVLNFNKELITPKNMLHADSTYKSVKRDVKSFEIAQRATNFPFENVQPPS